MYYVISVTEHILCPIALIVFLLMKFSHKIININQIVVDPESKKRNAIYSVMVHIL